MSTFVDTFLVLVFVLGLISQAAGNPKDKSMDGPRGSPMWFGPRLGKRSFHLAPENDRHQTFYRMLEAADVLKYYYDKLPRYETESEDPETRVTKKVVFTPILGRSLDSEYEKRSYEVDFTPRLGRRSEEGMVTPPNEFYSRSEPFDEKVYFRPRLGRTSMFSPRLGRELTYELPEKIRISRSVNKTGTN